MKPLFRLLSTSLLIIILTQRLQAGCGNDIKDNPCPSCSFIAYNGSETRQMLDLEVQGGVGEIPLQWVRHYYSRSFKQTYSFLYYLVDAGMDEQGRSKLEFLPPEGGYSFGTTFTQSKNDPSLWLPLPGVNQRLFQQGNNFFLQRGNGHRYRFEKINISAGTFYYLQDIRDNYQNVYKLTYDNNYNLASVTEPAGRYLKMTYSTIDGHDYLADVTGSDGRSVKYNYDIYNDGVSSWVRLIDVSYGDNTNATYSYGQPLLPNQQPNTGLQFLFLEHAIDPRLIGTGVNMRFTYDHTIAGGYIKEERNGLTNEVMTTLNTSDGNRWICHANGKVEHLVVPDELQGDVKERIDGLGRSTKYTYQNGNGFLETITDPLGRVTTYTRTIYGNLFEITHPDGSKEKWTRDDLEQILSYADELGRVTTYVRDDRHRISRILYPDGATEGFTYNDFGQVLMHTLRNGGTESNTYDNRGLKVAFTDAVGNITRYTYDSADRLASVTDANGNTTKREYSERGLLTKLINADNSSQSYTYDDFGNRTGTTNEIGNTWQSAFDEFKRIVSIRDPLNRETKYSYDLPGGVCGCSHDNNNPTLITFPSGKATETKYDVEWEKIKETVGTGSADAATTYFQYDLKGNLVELIDPEGKLWRNEYDIRDRKIADIDPLDHRTEYRYDAVGNKLIIVRPDGGVHTYVYDNMNRLFKTIDPKGDIVIMDYDIDGNRIKLIDPKGNVYKFVYDTLDREIKMIYPNNTFEQYVYDGVGNIKTIRNRSGDSVIYTYDARNREMLANWSDATPDVLTTYDDASRLLSLSSKVSVLNYSYNDADELLAETQKINGTSTAKVIAYSHNADGLTDALTYPDGTIVRYDFNGRNLISVIKTDTGSPVASYNYDRNGNILNRSLRNGTSTFYVYDEAMRIKSVDNKKGEKSFALSSYGYDDVSRRRYVQYNSERGDAYSYDRFDQLTGVQYNAINPDGTPTSPRRSVNYTYDQSGNRTKVVDNGVETDYASDSLNQYVKVGSNLLTSSSNGNIQSFNTWAYTYDALNRLIKAEKAGTTMEFSYDPLNRCVKRIFNRTTSFYYFDSWDLIEERSANDSLVSRYTYGPVVDEVVQKASSGSVVYYHTDAVGNVTQLTDSSGTVVEQYTYDVFGKPTIKDEIGNILLFSAYSNPFLFTSRQYIEQLELYDYRSRTYLPEMGRFLQPDPIGFNGYDYNVYRYVRNTPTNLIDPSGLIFCYPRKLAGEDVNGHKNHLIHQWRLSLKIHYSARLENHQYNVKLSGKAIYYPLTRAARFLRWPRSETANAEGQSPITCKCIHPDKCRIRDDGIQNSDQQGSLALRVRSSHEYRGDDEVDVKLYIQVILQRGSTTYGLSLLGYQLGITIQNPDHNPGEVQIGSGTWHCDKYPN